MAISALRHPRTLRPPAVTRSAVLDAAPAGLWLPAVATVTPALDLLSMLQGGVILAALATVATAVATVTLGAAVPHRPRAWLAAAALAFAASLVLRLAGLPAAPALSLLGLLALGVGGAFRAADAEADGAMLGLGPDFGQASVERLAPASGAISDAPSLRRAA